MATNEILRFAETDTGTNLLTQAEYLADSQRPIGNQPGVARSKLVNKALRQASLIAAGLAEYIADNQANNVTDALTPQNIADYLQAAITGALGVTPPQFDNDTSLATTAFVQRALGNMAGGADSPDASITLTAADLGKFYTLSSASAQTAILPLLSAVPDGATIFFHNPSNSVKTIQRQGSDNISPNGNFITSVALLQGEVIAFVKQNGVWRAGGTGALKYAGSFGSSLAANGYQKLPSGLIIQWGSKAITAGADATNTPVTFPVAFPSACVSVTGNASSTSDIVNPNTFTLSGFTATVFDRAGNGPVGGNTLYWIAIGY